MPLYEIVVKITEEKESLIFIDALNGQDALKHAKLSHEWHTDPTLDEIQDNATRMLKPVSARLILSAKDLRRRIDPGTHAVYPAAGECVIKDIIGDQ